MNIRTNDEETVAMQLELQLHAIFFYKGGRSVRLCVPATHTHTHTLHYLACTFCRLDFRFMTSRVCNTARRGSLRAAFTSFFAKHQYLSSSERAKWTDGRRGGPVLVLNIGAYTHPTRYYVHLFVYSYWRKYVVNITSHKTRITIIDFQIGASCPLLFCSLLFSSPLLSRSHPPTHPPTRHVSFSIIWIRTGRKQLGQLWKWPLQTAIEKKLSSCLLRCVH